MTKLKKIADDATTSVNTTVKGKIATVSHTVKENKDSPERYGLVWNFDFSKCTEEQIIGLAATTVRIMKQGDWRRDAKRMDAEKWHDVTFDVAAEITGRRKSTSSAEKVAKQAAKLSYAEKEELRKLLDM